jgi:exodeoxyribonuclease VII large subunit
VQALTVSAVVSFLREILEASEVFSDLWVAGEVSSFSRSQMGHRYLSLRDSNAVLRTVLFRDTMPGLQLKDGDRVLAHGRLTIYPQRGDLQFVCDFVRPEGIGLLAAKFEELKERLDREGLFEESRKRPLPRFPRRVGLVTSPAGAALQDVKNVLGRRWPLATLVVAPATVQGTEAPAEIASALRALGRDNVDFVIVARGGGSAEDLAAFNSEAVARAIFASPVPVVTGVGHETDVTIADYVADARAATPSAAVERSTPDIREVARAVGVLERVLGSAALSEVGAAAGRVEQLSRRMERMAPDLGIVARDLATLAGGMQSLLERRCAAELARFEAARAQLAVLDPRATLARGFAIVQDVGTRKVVNSTRRVRSGARLQVSVSDGAFWAEVS